MKTIYSSNCLESNSSNKKRTSFGYSLWIQIVFLLFVLYLVLPIINVPLIGLSLSAPLFFFVGIVCLLNPPQSWFYEYRHWIFLALILWTGIFISAIGNGILSGGVALDREGIIALIQYAYWLIVFIVTVYFASQKEIIDWVVKILGIGVFLLGLLRWSEAILYGKIGAWTGTIYLSQNDYGFLFSTFSPYLLLFLLNAKGTKLLWAFAANIVLWGAIAINGSRGSWVAASIGVGIALLFWVAKHPRKFSGILFGIAFLAGLFYFLVISTPSFYSVILDRANSFKNLNTDKSYMIRKLMNRKAILLFKQSPLLGIGMARFRQSSVPLEIPQVLQYAPQSHFDRKSAHNSYLSFLAENGLIGAIPFGLLLMTLFLRGKKALLESIGQNEYWMMAIFLGFLQMSIHMWVISSLTNTVTWFMYGLVGALSMQKKSI